MSGGDQRPMSIDNNSPSQLSINRRPLVISDPSAFNHIGQNDPYRVSRDGVQNTMSSQQPESVVNFNKKLQDDLESLGRTIKYHEENMRYLKSQKNKLEELILDLRVSLGKYHTTSFSIAQTEDPAHINSEQETVYHILGHKKSAAAIFWRMKTEHETKLSTLSATHDVIGIVATLGTVDDDNLSRLLSEFLGLETMTAIVCKTYEGVKALEAYDNGGFIDKTLGIHALGASLGTPLDGRFLVICLENLRPYVGKFIDNDPEKRLNLLKPRLPDGNPPHGFLGFAVNMITIDKSNLYYALNSGHGLRETLFYSLFGDLQVYESRKDMLKALPYIPNGAISLDGGILKGPGILSLGHQTVIGVKFPKTSGRQVLSEAYLETEKQMKETRWKKDRTVEDIQREQALIDHAKFNYEAKKREFLHFIGESSVNLAPQRHRAGRVSTPR